jgi:hypothetical protein
MAKTTTDSGAPKVALARAEGYLLVCGDGMVFPFVDIEFQGDAAGSLLGQPIVSASVGSGGYWLCAGDGAC